MHHHHAQKSAQISSNMNIVTQCEKEIEFGQFLNKKVLVKACHLNLLHHKTTVKIHMLKMYRIKCTVKVTCHK